MVLIWFKYIRQIQPITQLDLHFNLHTICLSPIYITASYCRYYGIYLYETTNTSIISPKAVNNSEGIRLLNDKKTTIVDAIVEIGRASCRERG